jgi:phosphomannomutase
VTPVSSNTAVERCGAFDRVVRTPIGSPYVIAGMASASGTGTVVAGYEANGGFLLGSPIVRGERRLAALPTRDAVLPMLTLLSAARDAGLPISALPATLPLRFTASNRLPDFASERSGELIERLAADESMAGALLAPDSGHVAHVDRTDGLRVAFASGDVVHLRASGNEPELLCYAESDTVDCPKQLCDDCLARIARGQTERVAETLADEWPETGTGGERW